LTHSFNCAMSEKPTGEDNAIIQRRVLSAQHFTKGLWP
jgi:hypothetical protein